MQPEILSSRDVNSALFSVPALIPFKLFKEIAAKVEEECRFFLVKNKRKLLHSPTHKTVTQSTPSALVIVLARGNGWRRLIKEMKSSQRTASEFSTTKENARCLGSRLPDTKQFHYIQNDVK
jgi:hypothetical protein